jgi:DNA-directed RNA polymerase subunit M/transcription elongation factor TFIIS
MAAISFTCPKCDQELEAPEDFSGEMVECPGCGAEITVPEPGKAARPRAPEEAADEDDLDEAAEGEDDEAADAGNEGVCPECGAEMEPDAVLCLGCGYHARLGRKIKTDFDE